MKKLIENSDLGIPYTTVVNRAIVRMVQSLLGINKINDLYAKAAIHGEGVDFARAILDELGVKTQIDARQLENIPRTGPFIIVSNHPYGALDGLLLISLIATIRPDVKFLGNFLLTKIAQLNDFFLPVDPFDATSKRNISGVRRAVEHLESGAPLVIFPAGEVSTYQRGFRKMQDKQWSQSMVKFVMHAKVPIIPLYIDGRNSMIFHLLGKIHPVLRTVRLPVELTNKRDRDVLIAIGSPLSPKRQSDIGEIKPLSDFLRANVYVLSSYALSLPIADRTKGAKRSDSAESKTPQDIIKAVDPVAISAELAALPATSKLFEVGNMQVYFASDSEIPVTLREISRLREVTFRDIGEGTMLELDGDLYDKSYNHLFIWNSENRDIVGAYRIGFGDKLLEKRGFEGFYTYTLFEFSHQMNDTLKASVELGRSFISRPYQRHPQGLLLLWRGILSILLRNPGYRYLLGPMSMSGAYSPAAKWIMIDYIRNNYWDAARAKRIVARRGIATLGRAPIDLSLLRGIKSEILIDKLLRDVDHSGMGLPVLVRKYLQLSGKVLSFNVDPLFNDSLDALLLLDLRDVPGSAINMVAREFSNEDVRAYFRSLGNGNV